MKLPETDRPTFVIVNRTYKSEKKFEQDMKQHPERYKEGFTYMVAKFGKPRKVIYEKKAIVEYTPESLVFPTEVEDNE